MTSFFDPDGLDASVRPMLLFVGEEPEVGMRFTYTDIDWEVVDYRDGWIARPVVD
jgi:hypothetical protein